jgi:hypothetical protein
MKTYISRAEALQRYKITPAELDKLLETDQLDTVLLLHDGDRELIIYDDSLAAYIGERDIRPENFAHLSGNLLGMNEAGLKYRVTPSTVSRWVTQGKLEVKAEEANRKLVDEADVAYLAALGRAKKMRRGKKVFN